MRLMYFNPTGQLGGAETSLLAVLSSVRRAEPSWPLHLVMTADGPLKAAAAALGVTATVLPLPESIAALGEHGARGAGGYLRLTARAARASISVPAYVAEIRRAIRSFRPDVIHTNGLKMHLLAAWASPSVPLMWHLHDYLGPRPLTAALLRWSAPRCAAVIANSMSVAADARDAIRGGVPVVAVYNAVDLDRFSPSGGCADLDRLAGLPGASAGTVRVGLLGTFARWKGHEIFLRALRSCRPTCRFAPTSSAMRFTRRKAVSIPATSSAGSRSRLASAIASASPDSSANPIRRCARWTSSSTRARSPNRSAW
jgi:glycosyltransferase involved in cell wall biosynthesis